MNNTNNKSNATGNAEGISLSAKSFILSIVVIFILMVVCYILTFIIPGGQYPRIVNSDGNTIIDTSGAFTYVEGGISFWKWLLSPFLVLGASGGSMLIAVLIFLLVIGGIFNSLEISGLMKYMLDVLTHKFGASRYKLMAILIFFFMAMGSLIGSFEEIIPMVPIVCVLAVSLGWDTITGFAMSLLAVGCGFAAGVCNPFTIGVAQKLSGLPMFSGIWLRAVAFVLIYILLLLFVRGHAKKIEKPVTFDNSNFTKNPKYKKGLIAFGSIVGIGILIVLMSSFITVLQDYTMIIVAVMFLIAGIVACLLSGMGSKNLAQSFGSGMLKIAPAILMILMASSIKYILEESKILDTILHGAVGVAGTLPSWCVILFIYLIVLLMNFFVSSGSAKAFMMIPLIVPIANVFGISAQLCCMAYAFGDGFSNVFYPSNAGLLISLNLADMSYGKWAKWSIKFQLCNLLLTSLILLFGLLVHYC